MWLLFTDLVIFSMVLLISIYACWKMLRCNPKTLEKYVSKRTYLIFYISAKNEFRKHLLKICVLSTALVGIIFALYWPSINDFSPTFKAESIIGLVFDGIIVLILWNFYLIYNYLYLDKAVIDIKKFDPNFQAVTKYYLQRHTLCSLGLQSRIYVFWKQGLFNSDMQYAYYRRRQFSRIYGVLSFYVIILRVHNFQKALFLRRKELAFYNATSTITFAEMLKMISDCFDHSEITIMLLSTAKYSKVRQRLDELPTEQPSPVATEQPKV